MKMHCWSCEKVTEFTVVNPEDGPVCWCGHYQESEAQGAQELCLMATWHDMNEYERVAAIARAGGFEVPDAPTYFEA